MCADIVKTLLLASDSRTTVLAASDNPLAYTPYGQQSAPGPVENCLGFNGQLHEQSTGWYHLGNGHRVYNPRLMRFHTPDKLSPFGEGGLNAYAYCLGDPVNYVDPTGQVVEWLLPAISILSGAGSGANSALRLIAPHIQPVSAVLKGQLLAASLMSVIGMPVSMVATGLLLAGRREEGMAVAVIGAALSAPVAWLRGSALLKAKLKTRKEWPGKLLIGQIPVPTAKALETSFPRGRITDIRNTS